MKFNTVSGKLAAHIKLIEPLTRKTVSVFMTRADDDLYKLNNTQRTIDGLDVKLWRERGLFHAMAAVTT